MADTTVIDDVGHWLASAAAASYQAMLAAGLPAGGINSAGRTNAEQRELYDELGPKIAAVPGKSPHEKGIALDVATSSAAQAWLLEHGDEFGWSRPLSNEGWHWQFGGGGGLVDTIGGAVGNVVSGARNLIDDPLGLSAAASDIRKVTLQAIFVLAGLGLIVLGVGRLVAPAAKTALDRELQPIGDLLS